MRRMRLMEGDADGARRGEVVLSSRGSVDWFYVFVCAKGARWRVEPLCKEGCRDNDGYQGVRYGISQRLRLVQRSRVGDGDSFYEGLERRGWRRE